MHSKGQTRSYFISQTNHYDNMYMIKWKTKQRLHCQFKSSIGKKYKHKNVHTIRKRLTNHICALYHSVIYVEYQGLGVLGGWGGGFGLFTFLVYFYFISLTILF
jgi:hypothetical protein